jgi:hypothetical protein
VGRKAVTGLGHNLMPPPVVVEHDGIHVVRDDLIGGGTKARFMVKLFADADEVVYATPAEGGAQSALAWAARVTGKRATLFVAKRADPHPRALMAKALGATVYQVTPGYLNVVQKRAQDYCAKTGATHAPFGLNTPEAIRTIADAARSTGLDPDEVWCASGSGVLARALAAAFPRARRHVVQVGRALTADDVAGAMIHVHSLAFGQTCRSRAPFPSDPHYDAKAWEIAKARRGAGLVLFWNVTGPADPAAA